MKQPRESTTRRLVSPRPCLQQRKTIGTRLTPTTRVRGSREGWESGFQPCDFFHYGVRQCGHAGLKRPHLLRPSSFVPRTCFVWQAAAGSRSAVERSHSHKMRGPPTGPLRPLNAVALGNGRRRRCTAVVTGQQGGANTCCDRGGHRRGHRPRVLCGGGEDRRRAPPREGNRPCRCRRGRG